jgi:RNA polymerase sigma-70 factor (ECF subfamily)
MAPLNYSEPPLPRTFEATRWSLVLRARGNDDSARHQALEALCKAYWYPLYAFLRRSGREVEDAQDLTQEFFAQLLDGTLLSAADPGRGKFRTLLISGLKNMDANAWRAARAQKRGGGNIVPLESETAEARWLADSSSDIQPELAFDRAWANTVMDRASVQLREEFVSGGKEALFDELFPRVSGMGGQGSLADVARRLGTTEAAVKMALLRMRQRFGDSLRAEISQTVGSREDVQDELRYLLSLFV